MRYTQLCKRDRDVVEFAYPLSTQKFTAKPIQRLIVELSIREQGRDQVGLLPERRRRDPTATATTRSKVSLERRDVVPEQRLPAGLHPRRGGACRRRS